MMRQGKRPSKRGFPLLSFIIVIITLCLAFYVIADTFNNAFAGEYNRAEWAHWVDADGDGQNTRTEMLIRDSKEVVRHGPRKTIAGKWVCPYTGRTYYKASDIDIDHVVPLGTAHKSGAEFWTPKQRRQFANDPENLLCVEDNANQAKGDKGPEDWRPYVMEYWPTYAKRWIKIKDKYHLSYTQEEAKALQEMLVCTPEYLYSGVK